MNQHLRSITNSLCCLAILPFFRYVKCRNWCWKLWYKSEVTWNSDYTGSSRTMSKKSHAALKFCKRKAKQQAVSLKSCCSRCKRQSCIFVCFLETLGTKSPKSFISRRRHWRPISSQNGVACTFGVPPVSEWANRFVDPRPPNSLRPGNPLEPDKPRWAQHQSLRRTTLAAHRPNSFQG